MTGQVRRVSAGVLVGVVLLAGCASSGNGGPGTASPTTAPSKTGRVTLVTLGSTDTAGGRDRQPLLETWPQLLYRGSFPQRATLVNLSRNRSRVADGLQQQAGDAVALKPTVAVVWFGTSDAFARTDIAAYRSDLADLVGRLTVAGARVLLVVGAPPPDTDIELAAYDAAGIDVAEIAGAELVDLRTTPATAESQTQVADAIAAILGPIP